MNKSNIILEVKNLKKYFPIKKDLLGRPLVELKAVDNVSFKLEKGKTIGVVGESGCGKTTLGRTILQLYDTTGGKTLYYGHALEEFMPSYYQKEINQLTKLKNKYQELKQTLNKENLYPELNKDEVLINEYEKVLEKIDLSLAKLNQENDKEQINSLNKTKDLIIKIIKVLKDGSSICGGLFLGDTNQVSNLYTKRLIKANQLYSIKENNDEYNALQKEIDELNQALENLKSNYKENKLFNELENNLENGINLAKLTTKEMRSLRKEIQLIFQDPYSSLPPRMTIGAILTEPVVVHNIVPKEQVKAHVRKIMKMCGLQPQYYDRYPHEFSGGQRQRICIARSLVVNPKLVICDEPVSALDVSIQAQIINLLKDLQNQLGLTYMFISHDLSVVKYITDNIIVMYLGNMMEIGDTDDIFDNPLHPYTKALFSAVPTPDPDAKMNRIILKGDIPSPANPPKGCKFHTRCDKCMSVCKLKTPDFIMQGDNHLVACHLYDEEVMANLDRYDEELKAQEQVTEEEKTNE